MIIKSGEKKHGIVLKITMEDVVIKRIGCNKLGGNAPPIAAANNSDFVFFCNFFSIHGCEFLSYFRELRKEVRETPNRLGRLCMCYKLGKIGR